MTSFTYNMTVIIFMMMIIMIMICERQRNEHVWLYARIPVYPYTRLSVYPLYPYTLSPCFLPCLKSAAWQSSSRIRMRSCGFLRLDDTQACFKLSTSIMRVDFLITSLISTTCRKSANIKLHQV